MSNLFEDLITAENENIRIGHIDSDHAHDLKDLFDYSLRDEQTEIMVQGYDVAFASKREIIAGIFWKRTDSCVGVIEIYHVEENSAELGYRMRRSWRNEGIMKEAVRLLLEALADTDLDILYADVDEGNIPSISVLEKNGFLRTGTSGRTLHYRKNIRH